MDFSFSGPSLIGLIPALAGAVCIGGVYCALTNTSALVVSVLIVREIADWAFYRLAAFFGKAQDGRSKAKVYAVTNLSVNLAALIALRYLELIANLGTLIFASLMVLELACKYADFTKYHASRIYNRA
jgi:hypothetical protein